MDTYIDFNDSYIFFDRYIYFFHIITDIYRYITISSKPPMPNSPHFLLLFLSQQLRQNNCP